MDFAQDVNEINGVNLDNYFPYQRTFDTVLYVHKRVLEREEADEEKAKKAKKKNNKNNPLKSKTNEARTESVFEQTVRFAKNLAPIVIPQNEGSDTPVFYTIETCSKCRRKGKKPKETQDDATYEKKKCKSIIETYKNQRKYSKKHSISNSVTDSSQSNTLDDLNINQSLNNTISEQSDKREKYVKNEINKRKRNKDKLIISESFEAVATEFNDADDTRIKVQLMNNIEKNAFIDSIRSPIVKAVRDCMSEFDNTDVKEEVKIVRKNVKSNTDKLDKILNKLAYIEKRIQNVEYTKATQLKASTLEQLSEDIDESCDDDEVLNKVKHEDRVENMGCGEVVNIRQSTSVGVKTERGNRIPARYCWTDSNKE